MIKFIIIINCHRYRSPAYIEKLSAFNRLLFFSSIPEKTLKGSNNEHGKLIRAELTKL